MEFLAFGKSSVRSHTGYCEYYNVNDPDLYRKKPTPIAPRKT